MADYRRRQWLERLGHQNPSEYAVPLLVNLTRTADPNMAIQPSKQQKSGYPAIKDRNEVAIQPSSSRSGYPAIKFSLKQTGFF